MKRNFYIFSFTALGILLQFLIHALVEIWYINLLLNNFPRYGFGLSWNQWVLIHHALSAVLFIAGATFGFQQGKYWWHRLYPVRTPPTS